MDEAWKTEQEQHMMMQTHPILWARVMLEEAGKVTMPDARDAILLRLGMGLLGQCGVTLDWSAMRATTDRLT